VLCYPFLTAHESGIIISGLAVFAGTNQTAPDELPSSSGN